MISEIDVAIMLVHPHRAPPGLGMAGQSSPTLFAEPSRLSQISQPLRLRVSYIVARVYWSLHRQSKHALNCLLTTEESQESVPHGSSSCPAATETCPVRLELLQMALHDAAVAAAEKLFSTLEWTLAAGYKSPELLLRPGTMKEIDRSSL